MSKTVELRTETPWLRLEVTDEDWVGIDPSLHLRMYEQLLLVRRFEERLLALKSEDLLHGPAHASIGQEGAAVGCMSTLGSGDKINGTHRMHHQFLTKALNHVMEQNYDPGNDAFSPKMQETVMRTMAEILGLSPGFTGGRGGSMHLKWDACGVFGSNAIIGGNPPHAAGYALAEKLRGTGNIAVTFFGDGALQNGTSYEAVNLAALYDLPVVFFCENNFYAVSTHVSEQTREQRLAARSIGLGVPGIEVDGMDPVAVREAMLWARNHIRDKAGPVFIEALTYRFLHQSGPLKGSAFGYRDKSEEEEWVSRDPLERVPERLEELGILDSVARERFEQRIRAVLDEAEAALVEVTGDSSNTRRIISALWPAPATVDHGIRGDGSELEDAVARELEDWPQESLVERTFGDALPLAALHNMEQCAEMIILGEDIHQLRGGTAGATRGVRERFPDRLIATPICENGFTGLAIGGALNGLRPVVEIMYPDFCLVAADQLFNQAAKVRHMFGGGHALPLVVRSRVSAGSGYGSQHSMDAGGLFALYPGWRIVAPSTPYDYIGLFNAAMRSNDPVLVIEYGSLFPTTGMVPRDDLDYIVPFGKARALRTGHDCTVVSYAGILPMAMKAVEETGVDADVIDLRTLDPIGLDWAAIGDSLSRTNRLLIAEQTSRGTSIGAHIVKGVQERFFDHLDAEIVHVSGSLSAPVVSKSLEAAALADSADIARGLKELMQP